MTEQDALRRFFMTLGTILAAEAARTDEPAAAAIRDFASAAAAVDSAQPADRGAMPPFALPVCRFWASALDAAAGGMAALAAGLRDLGPALRWTQNPNYRRRPPDPGFLENYGYAMIAGPGDRSLVPCGETAVGILLLGPGTLYPPHRHPAAELYCVVSGAAEWRRGDAPWRREPPGALIHHAPDVPHATRAGTDPLLAVYLWRGDLATHARLTPAGGDGAE